MIYRYHPAKESTCNLLIFLNGWGMTEAAVRHLTIPDGFDFLIGYDYRSLEEPFPISFEKYDTIWLAAWSMGVWAAEQLSEKGLLPPITRAIAIASSPYIREDLYGIPEQIFDETLQNLSEMSRERFNRHMCGGKKMKELFDEFADRNTEELKMELEAVRKIELERKKRLIQVCVKWEKAIVAGKDRIIPRDNLMCFWKEAGVPTILLPNNDHYLFADFKSWKELFEL